jgi:hypothetical protein
MKLEFTGQIFEKYSGAELFHAYRLTDMTKVIVAFRNFANSFKNGRNLETFQKKNASTEIGAHWIGKYFHLKDQIIEGVFDYFLRTAIKLVWGHG